MHMIGYHNFSQIKPEKFERQQYFHTLHFVISGKGYLHINGKKHVIYPGDVFYLDDQVTFSYYPDKDDPWEYVFFEFQGKLASVSPKFAGFSYDCPKRTCTHPQRILTNLASAFKSEQNPSYYIATSLFFLILDTFLAPETPIQGGFNKKDFIDEVKHFIQLKYLNPSFNIDYLCKK